MSKLSSRVLMFAAVCTLAAAAHAQSTSGDAKAGKDLFVKYSCYACHGFSGQNGPGARLVPMKMTSTGFIGYVRSPRTRQMPSYSTKVLPDGQLGDIYAYIKTLPDSPAANSISALDQFKEK
ncbi:MAG TPA: cytochrome c [Bryobacteraceae bacterium]|jgi:mono/diheme cytochrome c family protein|nr:cytochrome c [Bryobacteraceae bacterium]